MTKLLALLLTAWCLLGCNLLGGMRVDHVATSSQRPSNVAVYMSVSDGDRPITGLQAKDFRIQEDGQPLDPGQTKQTLLDRELVAIHRTLLLVDMSGPIDQGDARQTASSAVAKFVNRVRKTQAVTVYAFDGGARLRRVGEYPRGDQSVESISALESYTSSDTSSNLNSAVVEALEQLDTRLMSTQKPIRIGTLVVFARGADLAGRVSEDELYDAVDETEHHIMAIGIESEDAEFDAGSIGRDATFMASSAGAIGSAFDEASARVAATFEQYYLLSYCSPARAGERLLTIEAVTTDEEGEEISGSLDTDFDATGFTSGCNPSARPRFVIRAEPDDEDDDEEHEDAPSSGGSAPAATPPSGDVTDEEDDGVVPPPDKPGYAQ